MAPTTSKVESQVSKEGLTDDARIPNPPLVHITSPWLDSVTARIRARPIPWEGYARADLVSQDELKMIRSIDGNTDTEAAKVLDSRGQEYALLYLRLLSKLSRTDTLQQVLVLVGDMLQDRDDRLQLFLDAAEQLQSAESVPDVTTPPQSDMERWPWAPLVRLLSVNDDFAQLKAAQFITLLLVAPRTSRSATLTRNASTRVLDDLVSFLAKLINTKSTGSHDEYAEGNGADIALQVLESLLRVQRSRRFVWDRDVSAQSQKDSDTSQAVIPGLLSILQNALVGGSGAREQERKRERRGDGSSSNNNNSAGPSGSNTPSTSASGSSSSSTSPSSYQTQYQVIFCLWLLSFDSYIAANLHRKFNAIPLLVDLARTAVKEKVIRVIVATLRNLLSVGGTSTDNATAMLGSKLLPLVQTLQDRKWSDEDLPEDLEYLQETLQERLKGMTTFEEYLSELSSGKLSFDNPAHDLDDFWRANAGKLLDQSESKGAYPGDQDGEEEDKTKKESNGDDGDESPQDRVAARTGLNRLLDLLSTSQDATTLSVAIHDVGKLIQFTDTARRKINDAPNGGKLQVMQLMNHEDAEVKYRALSTVGKLMSASWR